MLAAKAKALDSLGGGNMSSEQVDETTSKLVAYISDQTHGIIAKGAKITGVPPSRVRKLPTTRENNFSLQLSTVQEALRADTAKGLIPFFICLTIGSTSSTAIDDVPAISAWIRSEFPSVFVHIDSAYAGSFAMLPEKRALFSGVEGADSFSFNPHKSMLVAFDCSCFFVRQRKYLLQALSLTNDGAYLRNVHSDSGAVVDLKDWQLPFGRRFRSIKLWFTLRSYGAVGVRRHLRSAIENAQRFREHIASSGGRFVTVCEPLHFGLMCFVLVPPEKASLTLEAINALNERLKEDCNNTGAIFFISTVLAGRTVLRLSCNGESQQSIHDVDAAWAVILEQTEKIWKEQGW
jgi:aromatic-L-amino-acid decarboxylase